MLSGVATTVPGGSFREFSNLAAGNGLRLYQNRSPSDEFRKFYFDTAKSGWQIHTLDGCAG